MRTPVFEDVHQSPNIQAAPEVYEIENRAADPEHRIEAALWRIHPWKDQVVVDLGAGTGYHLARFAQDAAHVIGVEPDDTTRLRAMERVSREQVPHTSLIAGSAEHLPLRDQSVDLVHARFAYFFGPGCEPGIAELQRVVRPGGTTCVIDNDLRSGMFASWLRRSAWAPATDGDAIERFWCEQGFTVTHIPSAWHFQSRNDLEAVIRLEFPADLADTILAEHAGTLIDYHYVLYSRSF